MENEEYNQVEPKYYNYKAKDLLSLELQEKSISYNNIYACCYNVINTGKFPFMRFLLTNSIFNKTLNFPCITIFKNFDTDELINFSKVSIFSLLMSDSFDNFNKNVEFNGFYDFNKNLYLFFDITSCDIKINDIYSNNNLWFSLIDEMINCGHVCGIVVADIVSDFLRLNNSFLFLLDENDDSYEIPVVGYIAKPENKLNFTYIFGESKSDKNSILGSHYYFTDFVTSFKDNERDNDNNKSGVVRFALFVGMSKYIENRQCDPIDESEIKNQRLEDVNLDQNSERLTMRISDHDGNWADIYDSVYLNNVELDTGKILDKSIIVLKEYEQQIPISYHYMSNKKIKTDGDYLIL